jgi:acetylornithine deacetylase/succinyl-diaminopimelate desuccinylase-like protein
MAFVEACRAWKAVTGQLPISVSVLVVGERRSGSARLPSILRMYADELNADIGLAPAARISCCAAPAINTMLRGLCREGFTIVAADHNQFRRPLSGNAADPTRALARIIGDLQDASGGIAIPGFYDRVDPLLRPPDGPRTDAQGDTIDVPCPPELVPLGSEHGTARIRLRRLWPTYDIDSVSSGRDDAALRSSLLPRASAKLSFHLVCDQSPDATRQAFRDFARARVASGCRIGFTEEASIPPVRFTMSHPAFRKSLDALTNEWGHPAAVACGDAAPAVHALWEALGMQIVVASFSCNFELCRGEREMPEPAKYRLGIRSWARILDALSR